jgi:hypothetical protein
MHTACMPGRFRQVGMISGIFSITKIPSIIYFSIHYLENKK